MPSPYRVPPRPARPRRRLWALRLGLPAALALLALGLHAGIRRLERAAASPFPLTATRPYRPQPPVPAWADVALAEEPAIPIRLAPGQTVAQVLDDLGVGSGDAQQVIGALAGYADLRRLRPVDSFEARVDDDSRLDRFALLVAGKGRAEAWREGDGWHGSWRPFLRTERPHVVAGELEDSLEGAIVTAGGEGMLAYQMSDVLQWDLDFNRDLRLGDRFEVLYERVYLDGRFEAVGEVVALRYVNGGRTLEAYRFGDPPGYYDAEGRPMRKMFLRSPLRFSRVTSRFSHRRFHPILKSYRPHYGVDYGAPTGTPVRVTGNGVVLSARWEKGGGRTVRVRHPNGYVTAYLHLSRFAASVRPGQRLRQGDLVGYVGATGLATAPHLDYRVQRDGRWIDPLSLKSIPTEPLAQERLAEFFAWRDALRESLATGIHPERPPTDRTADAGPGGGEVAPVAGGV
ncbi:MAG: peptidoglycan DD-metalloendopeptidase family protein [Thermoanaerobaculia bacterium]|nr:peptidoglycan DD-metalloendopeptidase family protein [Thermoanaerobaculia bacterium]